MKKLAEVLESPRLRIRAWRESDVEEFYDYAKEEGVGEMAGWSHHKSIEESKTVLGFFMEADEYAVTDAVTGRLYGSLGIYPAKVWPESMEGKKGFELGYVIGKKFWNHGYATEVVREAIRYLFFQENADYVTIAFSKKNSQSKRVTEKCGFHKFKDFMFHTRFGTVEDSDYTILYKEEYFTNEYYQLYDENLKPVDLKIMRPNYIPEGFYFGIVDCITYNKRNESFLVTRRSMKKPTLPGALECTCGAMQYGESELLSAERELSEETGIRQADFYLLESFQSLHAVDFMYLAVCDVDPDSIVLQEGETEEYFWLSKEEFTALWDTEEVTRVQKNRIRVRLSMIYKKLEEVVS